MHEHVRTYLQRIQTYQPLACTYPLGFWCFCLFDLFDLLGLFDLLELLDLLKLLCILKTNLL